MAPFSVSYFTATLDPLQTVTQRYSLEIPKWVTPGRAIIVGNVYTKEPSSAGTALCPEKAVYFCISRTKQGMFGNPTLPPPFPPQNTPGQYKTNITLSPTPMNGTYTAYVVGQASQITYYSTSTTFKVQNSVGYSPQAAFAHTPETAYINQTVNFDGSFSTPEGYGDTIKKWIWTFGDGTPKITETDPYITHTYLQANTFTVTLNVTDNENLWCTTTKRITILPESGPTARFTWTPELPFNDEWVTFNASTSTRGWSAKIQDFPPIQTYIWNFGAGNQSTTNKTISHIFGSPGNFTVHLWVIDSLGRSGYTSQIVEVLNGTAVKTYDVNGDGTIDLKDVLRVANAYGSYPGHPRWDAACDFNKDNKVDLKDYLPVAMNFGKDP
jgi:PKD repeat protein